MEGISGRRWRSSSALKAMPCGKWKGVLWKDVPDPALRRLLEWWTSTAPRVDEMRDAIVEALTGEWHRRSMRNRIKEGRKRRRRGRVKLRPAF